MTFQQKDNSGALFKNTDRRGDTDPDYRGSITVGGVEHWLNAWIKTSKAGARYMSLSAKPKVEAPDRSRSRADDLDDFVAF